MSKIERCPDCRMILAIVGIRHRCVDRRTDEAKARESQRSATPTKAQAGMGSERSSPVKSRGTVGKADPQGGRAARPQNGARYEDGAGVAPGPRDNNLGRSSAVERGAVNASVEGSIPSAPARKTGRPRIEDRANTIEARKPWVKAKMSRRTWYRRQKEKGDFA